jgi:poly(3-hydroxybutyrate) depolymerase
MSRALAALLVLAAAAAAAAAAARPRHPTATAAFTDVHYGQDAEQTLDIYQPPTTAAHKLVVFLHGGGWTGGNKNVGRIVALPLIEAGYAVASVEYRKSPQTNPAGEVTDAANAIAYLLTHAAQYHIVPDRFALLGHSSGAHMVALLGVDQRYLKAAGVDPARLAAVITLDGVFDVTANLTGYPTEKRLGVFGNDPATWKTLSPADLLAQMTTHPRFCIAHEDTVRRFGEQADIFNTALTKRHEALQTLTVHGIGHGQMVGLIGDTSEPIGAFVLSCLGQALPAK